MNNFKFKVVSIFIILAVLVTNNIIVCEVQNTTKDEGHLEESADLKILSESPGTLEVKNNSERGISQLKETVKLLNDQLSSFNSLYIGRLDQKLTSLVSNVASIDSNVKNIQERAHVWDTFQLHVSAWNDQIKSMDRKVDIINSGQEKMSLLEGKLSILLNLEYNSARIVNKLTSLEDRFDQMEKILRRQQSEISNMNQRENPTESQSNKNLNNVIPNAIKAIDRKTERLIGMVQRSTPLGRRFARSRNDSQAQQKIVIKCTTPPIVEEIVKDMQSKVDLIYDKILSDNISNDDCDNADGRKNSESSGEIDEEIEQDYPIIVFNSDEDSSEESRFNRQTRETPKANNNTTRFKRSDNMHIEYENLKRLMEKIHENVSPSNSEMYSTIINIANNIHLIVDLLKGTPQNDQITPTNIQTKVTQLKTNFKDICNYLQNKYTIGYQSDIKKYCNLFLSENKSEKISAIQHCLKEYNLSLENDDKSKNNEDWSTTVQPINSSDEKHSAEEPQGIYPDEFMSVCQYYISKFDNIENIRTPEELTCFIVYMHLNNITTFEYCRDPKPSFCDDRSFIIFQSRTSNSVGFSKGWKEYKWGFGDFKSRNYWIGNEALYLLTKGVHPAILRIHMEDFDGDSAWAEYDRFGISSEADNYRIQLSGYRGNSSDGLSYHNGASFSTFDSRHDEAPACCPCANSYGNGGWWYKSCFESNLNGIYFDPPATLQEGGISWELWSANKTLYKSTMALGFLKYSIVNIYDIEDP